MSSISAWDADPVTQFKLFAPTEAFAKTGRRKSGEHRPVGSEPPLLSEESAKVYGFMFGKFAEWLKIEGKRMSTIAPADLRRFVSMSSKGTRDLNSKIGHRYLRLLERCYEHLGRYPNPAGQAIYEASRTDPLPGDAAMTVLSAEDLDRFLAALPHPPQPARERVGSAAWKRRRDRSLQVVMALAGLRVAEAVGLRIEEIGDVRLDGTLELHLTPGGKHPTSHPHDTILRAEGVPELMRWLEERRKLKPAGALVFPADLEGGPLSKATVYRQVRASFERAGLPVKRAGGRTLRNSFARRQSSEGATLAELAECLGLAEQRSASVYQVEVAKPETTRRPAPPRPRPR